MRKTVRQLLRKAVAACLIAAMLVGVMPVDVLQVQAVSHTVEEALAWVKSLDGQAYDYDGSYGAQCVDLIKGYYNYLGVRPVSGNGCDYATNALPTGWQRIKGGAPQKGDILVYSGNESNSYGHVAIYEGEYTLWHGRFSGVGKVHSTTKYRYDGLTNPYWGLIRPDFNAISGGGTTTPTYTSSFPLQNNGVYKIVSVLSGKTMEVPSGTTANSKQISLWSYSGEPWMQWKAVKQSDGYSFINVYTGKCLDIQDASASGGAKLTQYDYSGNAAQRFKLIDKGNGRYGMLAVCSDLAVDVCGSDTSNGAVLDQHAFHGGNNQLWTFELIDTTAPKIENVKISNLSSTGYTVSCTVTDNMGVTRVLFPTWTDANGQDDLASQWPSYTSKSGNTYSYNVKISDHNNEGGGYTTHIYAYDAANNQTSAGICVTVNKEVPLTGFSLSASNLSMYKGTSETLSVTSYSPSNTTSNKAATWKSSDSNVASVNSSGVVTAHAAGTAVITCTVAGINRTCTVTVSEVSAGSWSDWTTSLSADITGNPDTYEIQQKTQYRSRTKQTTTSNQSSLSGWIKYGEYWGDWQTSTSEVASSASREVQRIDTYVKTQYKYSHWHNYSTNKSSPVAYSGWTYEETGWLDYALTYQGESSAGGSYYQGSNPLGPCGWATNWANPQTQDVYNTTWNYRDMVYQYYMWGNWTGWSDTAVTANDNVQVETRTVYRYRKISYPLKFEKLFLGGDGLVVNRPMTLTVVATGGQPAYQYRFVVLNEKTGESIVLQDYNSSDTCEWTPTQAGVYPLTIYVMDSVGEEVTWTGSVTISPEPIVIISQPTDLSLEWGQNGAFNVQVEGDGYTYQWFKRSKDSDKFVNITTEGSGYNTNTLQVQGDISNQDAQFKCIISGNNKQAVETNVVTLNVIIPETSIDEQPVDVTVEEGTSAYFDVKASGAGLQYQWQYCKKGTEEWINCVSNQSESNAAVLQIATSMDWDGTQFRCVITDCVRAQFVTDSVTLTVTEKVTVYTIQYILNGGINHEDNVAAYRAGEIIVLHDPVYEGKEFGGWFTLDGEQITSVSGGNITVEARWHDIVDPTRQNGELWIAEIPNQLYTGKAIKPQIAVYNGQVLLQENVDYSVTYKNNTNVNDASDIAKAPTAIVTGKGNYTSKETATFVIEAKNISDLDITTDNISLTNNGKVQKPSPVVKWNGKTLKKNKDYTLEYTDTTTGAYQNNGTYTIRIVAQGNFCGERTVQLQITGGNLMSKVKVAKISNQTYTGEAINPQLTVKYGSAALTEGIDYIVSYENNIETGTATAILTGKGSYTGEKKVTFKIVGTPISKAKVVNLPKSVVYGGKAVDDVDYQLQMKKDDTTVTLLENRDYTVSYKLNSRAGTATVLFTGINGYTGTLKKTFKITPYDILADTENAVEISQNLTVAYMKGGTVIEPQVTCFGKTLKKGTDYMLSYKNNKTIYTGTDSKKLPTVTISGKGNYKGKVTLNFTITEQNIGLLSMTAPDKVYQNKAGKYASTPVIKDVNGKKLTAGTDYEKTVVYTYVTDTMLVDGTVRAAGSQIESTDILPAGTAVKVTAKGKGNYTGEISCIYRIVQADIGKAKGTIDAQVYTGKAITPGKSDITLKIGKTTLAPTDYEIVSYSNNIKKGTATVVVRGVGNYGGTKTIKFKIKSKVFSWWWR